MKKIVTINNLTHSINFKTELQHIEKSILEGNKIWCMYIYTDTISKTNSPIILLIGRGLTVSHKGNTQNPEFCVLYGF